MQREGNEIVFSEAEVASYNVPERLTAMQALLTAIELRAAGIAVLDNVVNRDELNRDDNAFSDRARGRGNALQLFATNIEKLCTPDEVMTAFGLTKDGFEGK